MPMSEMTKTEMTIRSMRPERVMLGTTPPMVRREMASVEPSVAPYNAAAISNVHAISNIHAI